VHYFGLKTISGNYFVDAFFIVGTGNSVSLESAPYGKIPDETGRWVP